MEIARALSCEHGPVRGTIASFLLQFGYCAYFLELHFCLFLVVALITAKSAQDITSLVLATNFDKPSWRFREKPNDAEKE
jgi:hypothetical protein